MSTIAPPSKPLSPALVDSEHYIDDQIRRTRRALKLVDLASGLLTLLIGLLGFLLLAAVLDHWVVPGGLGGFGRTAVFALLALAVAWYGWKQFIPLLRPINPVYAAHTIERSAPSLKNSLLNLLLFRTHRQQMSARVYHALEQQAAQRLSSAPADASIDRSALLRLGYALLAIVAVCAAYSVLSPKNMAVSAARVLAPWSDLAAPSRVQILNIQPGDASIALGELLEVSAEINGLRSDERVRIRYSTADEQLVDETAPMKLPTANSRRYEGVLPRTSGDPALEGGVKQDLAYWIEAGDARSKKFNVTVFTRPTIIVQKVRYEYPAYTGFLSNEAANTGDVKGLEGTRVTISALANQPIKTAYVDFDADGRNDVRMAVDGDRATATFPLALREDRRTPTHLSYTLRFTSTEGRTNADPPKYRIDVTPDYAPEIRITAPEEPELTVRVDEIVPIEVEARDPDFALSAVRLVGKFGDREATLAELLAKRHEGRFGDIKPFTPADAQLKPGDVLEYWAEARDNRRPDANVALSEHRRLKIAAPAPPGDQKRQQQPGDQQPKDANQQQKDGESASADGQPGESASADGEQQPGENASGEQSGEDQAQQGPGGAGAAGEPGDSAESQDGAGGAGTAGESSSSDPQQQQQGAGGSNSNGGQQQDQQQQPSEGGQPGESASAGGQDGEPASTGGQQTGEGQPGNPNDAQGAAQPEKVSPEGDDDATAFDRIRQHLQQQQGQPSEDAAQDAQAQGAQAQGGQEQSGQQQQQAKQAANGAEDQSAQSPQAQDGQARPNQADNAQRASSQGQTADGQNAQGQPEAQHQPGDPAGDPQQDLGHGEANPNQPQSPPDKPASAAGQSGQQADRKPQAQGAQSSDPRQPSGDAQQQTPGAGDQRQGGDVPQDSKPGDGNPDDSKSGQQPSAESNTNNNQSDGGAGHNSDEQQGSAAHVDKRGVDKQDQGDRNKKLMGDEEPPSGADSPRESDSESGQSGDQSGGGQEGAGQHADAPGKGAPGQNEAADAGGGRADEQGQGETGSKPGSEQVADGQTGQSSGDQQGQGSQQGEAADPTAGQQADGQNAGAKAQPDAGQQGAQEGPQQGGKQPQPGSEQAAGAQTGGDQQGADAQTDQPPQQGEENQQPPGAPAGQQPSASSATGSGQAGSSQPQGGGHGGASTSSQQPQNDAAQADEANLEFARKQTDLVLERLDEQLAEQQVDEGLLDSLGWSQDELQKFVSRWKDLKTRADDPSDKGDEARQELDDALRSLGLRVQGPTRVRATTKADDLKVNDSYRRRVPIEYADRAREYSKNVAAGSDE